MLKLHIGGHIYDRCPKAWARDEAAEEQQHIRDWDFLATYHRLPRSGGTRDQDPHFIEAVAVINAEMTRIAEARQNGAQGKQKPIHHRKPGR